MSSSSCPKPNKILTRAARKKAGLSPPPSLYNGVPRSVPATAPSSAADRDPSSSAPDSESSSDEETQLWVQCDTAECKKWRILPKGFEIDTESMHPDPALQSCDAPEQKWRRERFAPGQLVWAKMNSFPPWPAIVTPDPWSDDAHMCKEMGGCIYHVEFLGRVRTHLWLVDDKVEAYCSKICSLGRVSVSSPSFTSAVAEAETLKSLTNSERLTTCTYILQELKKKAPQRNIPKPKEKPPAKRKTHQKKNIARTTASMTSCGLSTSQKLLQKFIQTHFKLDIDGVLKLAMAPSVSEGVNPPVKRRPRKIRTSKKLPQAFTCNTDPTKMSTNAGTLANGSMVTQQNEIQSHKSDRPRISPTISDYLNRPANTGKGLDKVVTSSKDQVVPDMDCGNCFSSVEAQAQREMEEIEGLLSVFADSRTSRVTEHEHVGTMCTRNDQLGGGLEASGGSGGMCGATASSEWIESVLGEIDQIEGMIQELSKEQVAP